MYQAISYPLLTGGVQICALLIRSWPEPLRYWNFYSIFTEVFPLSKKHIHSFNPKTNFLETVLNQTSEKKCEMAVLEGKFQKQEMFFYKTCKRSLSTWNKNTIYYIYYILYTIIQKSNQKIAMLYCKVILLYYFDTGMSWGSVSWHTYPHHFPQISMCYL